MTTYSFKTKHLLLLLLGIAFAFVFITVDRFLFDPGSDIAKYYFNVRWWILPHALAGLTALITGALQFSQRLRKKNMQLHRRLGRIYFLSVAVAASIALPMAIVHPVAPIGIASFLLGITWISTSLIAFLCAVRRNIPLHKQWTVRSYAVTGVFVTSRIPLGIPAIAKLGDPAIPATIYVPLILTLLLTEIGLQWKAINVRHSSKSLS